MTALAALRGKQNKRRLSDVALCYQSKIRASPMLSAPPFYRTVVSTSPHSKGSYLIAP